MKNTLLQSSQFLTVSRFLSSLRIFLFLSLLILPTFAQATDMSLNATYPSPDGIYSQLYLSPQAALPTDDCPVGTFYVNASDNNRLYFCKDGSPSKYVPFPGVWTLAGDNLYLTDNANPNIKVGIGTTTPIFRLSLDQDGGLLAQGPGDPTTVLTTAGAGTRLIWYHNKASLRAGYVNGTQWDDANIRDRSVAFGRNNLVTAYNAFIMGGEGNSIHHGLTGNTPPFGKAYYNDGSRIIGGLNNTATAITSEGYIIGGELNTCNGGEASACQIVGGYNNKGGSYSPVVGGASNTSMGNAMVGGGENAVIPLGSYAASLSVIGGGRRNVIQTGSLTSYNRNTIIGGYLNYLWGANAQYSTIMGGREIWTSAPYAAMGGGQSNQITAGSYNTLSGGYSNVIPTGTGVTLSGGNQNIARNNYATVSGGYLNQATGINSIVVGGQNNIATGLNAVILGGRDNIVAGDYSLAMGRNMNLGANADRTFIFGYSATPISAIQTADAFLIYSGKVGVRDTTPTALLEINGQGSTDDYLAITSAAAATPGDAFIIKNNGYVGVGVPNPTYPMQFANGAYVATDGKFMPASSRIYKENISMLNSEEAMNIFDQLQPVKFNYKSEPEETYLGFVVEDVPAEIADKNRQGLSPLDFAALLTKVVQEQQAVISKQNERREQLLRSISSLEEEIKKINR